MSVVTRKSLFVVNHRSGWAVVAALTSRGEGRERDSLGRYAGGEYAFESVRVKDRRIARFSSLEAAVSAVSELVSKSKADEVFLVPATKACEEAMVEALHEDGSPLKLIVRRSIPVAELDAKPRTPFAQAWHLARRAWFNDNVDEHDTWFVRN